MAQCSSATCSPPAPTRSAGNLLATLGTLYCAAGRYIANYLLNSSLQTHYYDITIN